MANPIRSRNVAHYVSRGTEATDLRFENQFNQLKWHHTEN